MAIKGRRAALYPAVNFEYAKKIGLDEIEWDKIIDRLGRSPNHFECEIFATLWSEEVSNKSTNELLKTIESKQPKEAPIKTVPGSQIGLLPLSNGQFLSLRVVNNNYQSSIDAFYGSQTAIDEAIEEVSSVGAKPIGILNMLRFGNFELIKNQELFRKSVDGISSFGNKYGVPVVGDDLYFHKRYNNLPMVNCGVIAVSNNDNALNVEDVPFKSPIVYVGARTGRDGLEETLSEKELELGRKPQTLLKMSDPLLSNRLVNACSEAIEVGLLRELVVVGKGGLAVAAFDLSKRINKPILLDVDRIPLLSLIHI